MFKFLLGRIRPTSIYAVYYTVGEGTFTLKANVPAENSYEANRRFDMDSPTNYRRVSNATRRIK